LENLFSCIRFRQSTPHALAFKQNLKVIPLAQFCRASPKSSYEQDDGELIDLLTLSKERAAARKAARAESATNTVNAIVVPVLSSV